MGERFEAVLLILRGDGTTTTRCEECGRDIAEHPRRFVVMTAEDGSEVGGTEFYCGEDEAAEYVM